MVSTPKILKFKVAYYPRKFNSPPILNSFQQEALHSQVGGEKEEATHRRMRFTGRARSTKITTRCKLNREMSG
jgi:hypothetical protein